MAAPWRTIQLGFRGGVDQKTVAEYVDPETRLLDVINGVFTHDGAIEKRPGMQALATQMVRSTSPIGVMGAPVGVFSLGTTTLATDGDGLYSYSPSLGGWAVCDAYTQAGLFSTQGGINSRVAPCTATRAPLSTSLTAAGPTELGIGDGSGVRAFTWRNTGGGFQGVNVSLYDLASGSFIGTALLASGSYYNPIPIVAAGYVFVFYSDASHVYCSYLNLATIASTGMAFTQTTIVSDAANQYFDATPESNGSNAPTGIVIAYNQTGSAGQLRYLRLEALPALTISASGLTPAGAGVSGGFAYADAVSCRVDVALGIAYFAWENAAAGPANTLLVAAYNVPAWTQINLNGTASAFQPAVPGYTQGGSQGAGFINVEPLINSQGVSWFLVQAIWGTAGGPYPGQAVYTTGGQLLSSATYPYGMIAGRTFRATVGGQTRCYVPFCFFEQILTPASGPAFQFGTLYLMDTRAYETAPGTSPYPRAVATLAPRQTSQAYYANTMQQGQRPPLVTQWGAPAAGSYVFPLAIEESEEWQTAASPQPVVLQLATATFARTWSYAEGNGELYVAGGVPQMYAGQGINELGFLCWPSRMNYSKSTGGGLQVSSTYGYAFVFSEPDASGLIHRSAAYLATALTDASSTEIIWTIPGIPYTQRGNVVIEVYRTQANLSTYYYVGQVSAYGTGITGTVSFTDAAADTAIAGNALLYTTGGVLDSVNPPSLRLVIRHVDRLWGIDDTGLVIWFTTQFSPSDAPWFNEGLTLQFTTETLTALGSMDDKLVVFSANHIWYVEGTGPDNLGQGSDLTQAVLLPSDVGAASWQSVVAFPGGLLFQAPSGGIYLLDRGLSVSFLGKEVQDITAGVSVVSARLVSSSNQIRFVLSTGIVLVFDYVLGRWSRQQLTPSVFGNPSSSVVANGTWSAACSGGMVAQEKSVAGLPANCYQDSTAAGVHTFVPTQVRTAWVKPGGLDGWAQLGEIAGRADWLDPADIICNLSFDYGAVSQTPGTFTYGALHGAYPSQARWRAWPQAANTMASAVQVILLDEPPTGGGIVTGQGVRWLGLSFDVTPLGDRNLNLAATQKR